MPNTGKELEALVALIEKFHLPPGFEITTNERIYDDQKKQIAEFDIQVKGRLGTTDLAWLIECRDRPSEGPAPRSWIEQLVGRRIASGFNKVTAVSATGFTSGALDLAKKQDVEIREMRALTPENFAGWLAIQSIPYFEQSSRLLSSTLVLAQNEPAERQKALGEILAKNCSDQPLLRNTETNEVVSIISAFAGALSLKEELFDEVIPNQPERPLTMKVSYQNDKNHFVVDTHLGAVRIHAIVYNGALAVKKTEIPLASADEYLRADSGEMISQSATFAFTALDAKLSLEMHKVAKSGEIQVVLRKLGDAEKP
jgi:hypothetical protein